MLRRHVICGLLLLLGSAAMLPTEASGQAEEQENQDLLQAKNAARNEIQKYRVDVLFKGGTVDEFLGKLRDKNPKANVLVTEQAGRVILPTIEMKDVTFGHALETVELLTGRLPNPVILETIPDHRSRQLTWVFDTKFPEPPMETTVSVVNARAALFSFQNEDAPAKLMSTIDQGLGTVFGESSATISIKLHPDTGLIFVKGRQDKVAFVRDIIGELEKNNAAMIPGTMVPLTGSSGSSSRSPSAAGNEKSRKDANRNN